MDMNEEEQGELLWRHIVDVKYGGRADVDGKIAQAELSSSELREMGGLAADLHRSLYEDPAYAQSAARSRLLEFIETERAPITPPQSEQRRPFSALRSLSLGRRPAMVLVLVLLMASAVAAVTAIVYERSNANVDPGLQTVSPIDCDTPVQQKVAPREQHKFAPGKIPAGLSAR